MPDWLLLTRDEVVAVCGRAMLEAGYDVDPCAVDRAVASLPRRRAVVCEACGGTARSEADEEPWRDGETPGTYTDRVTGADKRDDRGIAAGRNRQCSIGYHLECSDPAGESCACPCHVHCPDCELGIRVVDASPEKP